MLILKNISKKYEGSKKYVLKNINLSFKDNGLVCILGESGSGKTTLLNLIAGIDKTTKGEIYIDRTNIDILKKEGSLYQSYIGVVFQNYNLINNLNVEDNIKLLENNKVDTILKKVGLKNKQKEIVNKLSGGQQQRIAIARALYSDKKILLCDEPTGALDHNTSENIMKLLKSISKDKLVIVITHNEKLADKYSDRIIKIEDGKILEDTTPQIINEQQRKHKYKKNNNSLRQLLKQILLNIKTQKKKTVFKMTSLIISLISLLLILSISIGFNISIEKSEKDELSTMPIYISETSTNIKKDFNNLLETNKPNQNYIYSKDINHINKIDKELVNTIKSIENTHNIITNILKNNMYLSIYDKNIEKDIELIGGNVPINKKDILLVIDSNNVIDDNILKSIGINKEHIEVSKLINFKINNKYKISGIAKFKEESPMYDNTGLYTYDFGYKELPIDIFIYPSNYKNKKEILNKLNKIDGLEYLDYSDTVISVSKTVVSSIAIVLSLFSIISIIIASLMNYILTYISIEESIKNIGIYIVNGVSKKVIKLIYILENIFISLISTVLSIIVIYILSIPINYVLYSILGLLNVLVLTKPIIIGVTITSLIITLISTLLPLNKINKLNLVDILKYN